MERTGEVSSRKKHSTNLYETGLTNGRALCEENQLKCSANQEDENRGRRVTIHCHKSTDPVQKGFAMWAGAGGTKNAEDRERYYGPIGLSGTDLGNCPRDG